LFVSARVANNRQSRLPHPAAASQRSVEFSILHQRNFGKSAHAPERRTPAEDPVIAKREAKDMDTQIPQRIAHPVNPFPARQSELKAAAGVRVFAQYPRDFCQSVRWNQGIGVQEPEHLAAPDIGAGIHLPRSPARNFQDAIRQPSAQFDGAIIAPAIDDHDFGARRDGAKVPQECANQFRFIESGHNNRNEWLAHD